MLNWIDKDSGIIPPTNRPLLCYCPEWSETGYQVAYFNKADGFYYHEQPNDIFPELIEKWAIFLEAD